MLNSPASSLPPRAAHRFRCAELMEYSEQHLAKTAQFGPGADAMFATRLLQDVSLYQTWAHSHELLMRSVTASASRTRQALQLKRVTFLTLHRKAPFEYLRDRRVTGLPRRILVRELFGAQDYTRCILREHVAFLTAACSFICADSLCEQRLHDQAFCRAMEHYYDAYTEYYRAFCDSLLAAQMGELAPLQPLLPYLRYRLKIIREHMLAGAPQQSEFTELQALYAASGDTQKLRTLRQE